MRADLALAFACLIGSCGSPRQRAFDGVAGQLNPILVTVIPKLSAYVAYARTANADDPELLRLCRAADPELERMSAVSMDQDLGLDRRKGNLAGDAGAFVRDRDSACWNAIDQRVMTTCKWFCLDRWSWLSERLGELRQRASNEGVAIYGLPLVTRPKL